MIKSVKLVLRERIVDNSLPHVYSPKKDNVFNPQGQRVFETKLKAERNAKRAQVKEGKK